MSAILGTALLIEIALSKSFNKLITGAPSIQR